MKQYKFKNVVVWHRHGEYHLCHTLEGLLNPFYDFSSEEEARKYAKENGLVCDNDVYEGTLAEWGK